MSFKDQQLYSWMRYCRNSIRDSDMTSGQKKVTTALVNLWFHHRAKGVIHPGRALLAKKAKVTEKTVSRTLAMLRVAGVLVVKSRLHGQGQRPTEYRFVFQPFLLLCGASLPEWMEGELKPLNVPPLLPKMSHHWRDKMSHSSNDSPGVTFSETSDDEVSDA